MRPALHLRLKKAKFSGCQSKKSSCSFLTNSDMMFQGQEAKKMIDLFNCPEMIKNVLKMVYFVIIQTKKKKNRWYKQTDKIRANKIIINFTSQGKPDKT